MNRTALLLNEVRYVYLLYRSSFLFERATESKEVYKNPDYNSVIEEAKKKSECSFV